MRKSGFTLLETVIGVLIEGITLLLLARGYFFVVKRSQNQLASSSNKTALYHFAIDNILHIGRVAFSCNKQGVSCNNSLIGPPTALYCCVDRARSGTPTDFRIVLVGTDLLYQKWQNSTWRTLDRLPNTSSFLMCDDNDMLGGSCAIASPNISAARANDLNHVGTPSYRGRFFRFLIQEGNSQYQSAFFVRNPTPQGGLAYEW